MAVVAGCKVSTHLPKITEGGLGAALAWADAGFPVFPCGPDKRPHTTHGFKDATTEAEQIRSWWATHPEALIGVPTGAATDLLVLDINVKAGAKGAESLHALVPGHGRLPATPVVQTRSGGFHYLFRHFHGMKNTVSKISPGIDTRTTGGYVIAAGSTGYSFRAGSESFPIADAPEWLIELAMPEPVAPPAQPAPRSLDDVGDVPRRALAYVLTMPPSVEGSNGSAAMMAVIRALRDGFDLTGPDLWRCIDAWNAERASPAWSRAELEHALANVESEPAQRGRGWLLNAQAEQRAAMPEQYARACDPWPTLVPLLQSFDPPAFNSERMIPAPLQWFRDWCAAVSRSIGVAQDWPAVLGIGVASLAAAGAAEVELWDGYVEPAPLWVLALAPPSMRKSPAFTLATAPLRAWELAATEALHIPLAKHRSRRSALEKRIDKLKTDLSRADDPSEVSRMMGGLDRAAEELSACSDLLTPCLTTSDVTPEGLGDLMHRNGGPVGIVDDEGAAVACLLGRYSEDGARVELACKAYSGTPATIARKGRDPLIIQRPLLAMILAAQPAVLASVMDDLGAVGRGFLARFTLIRPPPMKGGDLWNPGKVPDALTGQWADAVQRILNLPRPGRVLDMGDLLVRSIGQPENIRLSQAAADVAKSFHVDVAHRREEGGPLDDAHGWSGKLRGNVYRIALALHLLTGAPGDVTADTMRAAVAWGDYLHGHMQAALGELANPATVLAIKVEKWIVAGKRRTFTAGECFRALKSNAIHSPASLIPAYDLMSSSGQIRRLPDSEQRGPGRPANRFEVSPALLTQ